MEELQTLEEQLEGLSGSPMDDQEWEIRTRLAQLCTDIGTEYRRCGNREVPEQMMHRAEAQLALGGDRIFDLRGSTLRRRARCGSALFDTPGWLRDYEGTLFAAVSAQTAAGRPLHLRPRVTPPN